MVDSFGSDDLVFHENRGGNRAPVEDIQTHTNQAFAISLREVTNRAYQPRIWLSQLYPSFRRAIVAHDRAAFRASRLLKGAQPPQSTGIVDGPDDNTARICRAQMLPYGLETLVKTAVAIYGGNAAIAEIGKNLLNTDQQAG